MQPWSSQYAFPKRAEATSEVDESSCISSSSPQQQAGLSKKTSSSFQASLEEFKLPQLPHSPAASSSSSASSMDSTAWEPRRSTPAFANARRRPSMLNSEMTMDTEFGEDDRMDSPFAEDALPSPTVPVSTPNRQVPASVWPRGSSFANAGQAIPRNAMHDEAMDGFANPALRTSVRSSFNPLNPLGIRHSESKESMQPEPSTSQSPVRPTTSLQRAKSSPALGKTHDEPATPPSHRMTMDDQSQTFDGLGMSLPDQDSEQISSPPKGPVRRPVAARRGTLFVRALHHISFGCR